MTKEELYDLMKKGDYMFSEKSGTQLEVTTGEILEANATGMRINSISMTIMTPGSPLEQAIHPYTTISGPREEVLEHNSEMQISNDPKSTGLMYLTAMAVLQDGYRALMEEGFEEVCDKAKIVVAELGGPIDQKENPLDYRRLEVAQQLVEELDE